MVGQVPGMV